MDYKSKVDIKIQGDKNHLFKRMRQALLQP